MILLLIFEYQTFSILICVTCRCVKSLFYVTTNDYTYDSRALYNGPYPLFFKVIILIIFKQGQGTI